MEIIVKSHDVFLGYYPETECPNFDSFAETFSNAINDSCKLLSPKSIIRNADSVINAIETKQ